MRKKLFGFSLIAIIALLLFGIIWHLVAWKSPSINNSGEIDIHTCIHLDNRKLHFTLDGGIGKVFYVSLVENSEPNCLNPYFPSIHIKTTSPHNAWIHIVYTDFKMSEWRIFIDALDKNAPNSPYPFYTYEQDFYDAPFWSYSLLNKPLSLWKGHVFAVQVDHQKKSINCLGGVEWGFELSQFKLRPKAINPKSLNKQDWDKAWQILQQKLPGYRQTYM